MRTYILLLFTLYTFAATAQNFNDLCRKGIDHIKNYEFQKAIANFEKAESASTSKHEKIYCLVNIAYSKQMLGDLHGALKSYNNALQINSKELTLIQQRANIYLQLDSVDKALADYNTILKEEESNTGALLCRAHIYTNIGKYREAWNDYAMLERWLPDNLSVQLGIAILYQKENKYTECMEILENLIKKNPDLVKRMADEGHLVCNHTSNHKDMTKLTDGEILANLSRLEEQYKTATGYEMEKIFRFPEGKYSIRTMKLLCENGYKTVFWSMAYDDWDNSRQMDVELAKSKLISTTHDGAIILLHPTSATNAAILSDMIKEWRAMGYTFGSLKDIQL